jgi:cytoskeletal protein CcmA (bactofilin family)
MAIPILNHLNVKGNINLNDNKLNDFVVDHSTEGDAGNITGKLIFDSNVLKFYNGSSWQTLGTTSGTMSSWVLEDGDGTEKTIQDANEVKFIDGAGLNVNFTGSGDGSDGDPIDLTFEIALATSDFTKPAPANGDVLLTLDSDGSTTQFTGVAELATLFAGTGLTATNGVIAVDTLNQDTTGTAAIATTVTVTDNESTNEENAIIFAAGGDVDGGNLGMESDGDLTYNPSTGTVSATIFKGNIDAVDGDFDGTLEADAITVNGTALDEFIQDTVGAMFSSNTETRVTVTYQDDDGTIDVEVDDMTANTDVDVNIANLTARLPQITESVTIGDATDVTVTTSGNLVVTGDLTVSGDTVSANVATLDVEDKNITLNKSGGDSSSTADGAGITIQDAVNASTDATLLWNATSDKFVFSHLIEAPGTSIFTNLDISGNVDIDGTTNLDAVDIDGNVQLDGTLTVGVNDTGFDVKFFGDTASKYMLWDASADTLEITGELDAGSLDISGDADIDGTLEADAITVAGTALNTVIDNRIKVVQKTATIDVSSLTSNVNKCSITHGLNSTNLIIKLYDSVTFLDVFADVDRLSVNQIQVTFSHQPSNDIIVVIQEIIGDNISAGSDITYPSS